MSAGKFRHFTRQLVVVCLAMLVLAAPLVAAEAENDTGPHSPIGMVFRWINVAVAALGLGYLMRKLPGALRRRSERIGASIAESGAVKAEAEKKLRESEELLARLDQEVAAMREGAMRDAAAERERIRATARDEAAKVQRAAEAEIAAAERAARIELKAMAARLAVERAEAEIRMRITTQAEAALFRTFVGNLARSAN
jgi:F0F1-type ATP synthase membrane subunit b/b'